MGIFFFNNFGVFSTSLYWSPSIQPECSARSDFSLSNPIATVHKGESGIENDTFNIDYTGNCFSSLAHTTTSTSFTVPCQGATPQFQGAWNKHHQDVHDWKSMSWRWLIQTNWWHKNITERAVTRQHRLHHGAPTSLSGHCFLATRVRVLALFILNSSSNTTGNCCTLVIWEASC